MLTQKSLSTPNLTDDVLNRSFQSVANVLNPVLQTSILDGVLVKNLVIPASGKLVVAHGLGRVPNGWLVVAANNAVSVPYALAADQTAPNGGLTLTFTTGASAKVSLWIF